jgi:uncharacterized protein
MFKYQPRIVDLELDELLEALPAISLEGPKAVGKTATSVRRARTVVRLDDPAQLPVVAADPLHVLRAEEPILIDEWQRAPAIWDAVRREVDRDASPARFLLTGSASPTDPPTHSGAGRIVTLRMRPMALAERGISTPTVSLRALLSGEKPGLSGETELSLANYTREIVASGFPGLRHLSGRALRAQLDSYISRIVDRDFLEQGHPVRRPQTLRQWMTAYAAATATTATYETIRDAATSGQADKPPKSTVIPYRDVLQQLWILDPVPAWTPTKNPLSRLARSPKHQLADPALAAHLLGASAEALLRGDEPGPPVPRDGTLLGHLFESLVTLSVRVYAQAAEATVGHLQIRGGRREIDLIVERPDGRVVAIEVKVARTITDGDVRHLLWLRDSIGVDLLDAVVIHAGPRAYRRSDGIGVIPASLLGP